VTRHSFWPGWTARGGSSMTGNGGRSSGRSGAEQRGVRPNGRRDKAEWALASSVMFGAVLRRGQPTWVATTVADMWA
jgi:hypothetical protein